MTAPYAMNANGVFRSKTDKKPCAYCGQDFYRDERCTWAHWGRAKYCTRQCAGFDRAKQAAQARPAEHECFAKWILKGDGCWIWSGACDRDGYGIFSYAGKTQRAPIVALKLDGRPVSPGQYACHRCDNPPCVRPDHLYPGTPTQNMADAQRRGRVTRGVQHKSSKLTDEAVRLIRASDLSEADLAKTFGVSRSAISLVRSNKTWSHVR